ncbi:radical SAM protein [Fusobacterium nucleatum subsp. nucleatum ATCC 23726]|uniref:Fe-S oxidoreductase n=3 Tax=Fusobacterium nucleatum subsp. nucleatum TaxID=76856 RepID=Q8R6C0_FUSNN|nr:radical SAM protein [Fusobacterium nucleatum]AAL94333.1 Fe-S oxidoreductase [Fusobacterium nucleatum subsp. nucleatum ATCC 25586]ALF26181.1 radical SAM protein [Fusobacterium nucleatum subsp. nucleatum]AVQ14318.1 radical SAM protein [Fusobacterium nucleatum subsp. nucleatum ATCC 25586]AVQ22489.1 radical SAM protein [Fusobacterium nucleatum subsp. nucleatum ATCC 23726]EFG94701.1 radical SAM domain protein [Fusobacterium nucleatum subsp. nucleatum ATCC 23726]
MYKHVFGPVPSRRLGISLGVDLVVSKSCNLNCIFCECGATKKIQLERQRFKDMDEILNEIQSVLKNIKPDYITFSGSGEPTLSLDLGNISKAIKEDLKYKGKICLITNSLLLANNQVIKELEYIDLIVPTLNTLKQDIFEKIVRPDYRTSVDEIKKGFVNLNNSNYKGKIWIEIFILENINDSEENFIEIANFLNLENIRYDKIQLNTIDRVGAERDLKAISFDKIFKAKKILEENELHNIEIIKSLNELDDNKKILINQELLDNMKQKRLYQEEEINKIFKKS